MSNGRIIIVVDRHPPLLFCLRIAQKGINMEHSEHIYTLEEQLLLQRNRRIDSTVMIVRSVLDLYFTQSVAAKICAEVKNRLEREEDKHGKI